MIEYIWDFFLGISNTSYSFSLGCVAFIETLFPPFPGDVLYIALSGLGFTRNMMAIFLIIPGILGCLLGTILLDFIGRTSKIEQLESYIVSHSGKNGYQRAKKMINRYGKWILIGSRFIPGIRSLLVIVASSSGLGKKQVILYTTISTVAWYGLMTTAGFLLGAELAKATGFIRELTGLVLLILFATALVFGCITVIKMWKGKK